MLIMANESDGLFKLPNPNYKTNKRRVKSTNLQAFTPTRNDGSVLIGATDSDQSVGQKQVIHNVDFNLIYSTERNLILQYREAAQNAEISSAVIDIVNEAIVMESEKPPVSLNLDSINDTIINDQLKETIQEEFDYLLRLLKFRHEGDELFQRFYIDGRSYFHKIIDTSRPQDGIKDIREIDPLHIKKVKIVHRERRNGVEYVTGEDEFYSYSNSVVADHVLKIDKSAIAYINSGLYDSVNSNYKKREQGYQRMVISYLHQAIRPWNQLRQLEDAHLIYSISRAPQRRVFYVDIGNLNKTRGEEFMQLNMNRYKNKLVYESSSGQIKNQRHTMSMMEDVWLPRKGGSRGTEVDTLPGGGELGNMDLINVFRSNLQDALHIPASRQSQDSMQSFDRQSEISRDELKFQRFVDKLRNRFSKMFLDVLKSQLILKRIISSADWDEFKDDIRFDFANDSYFSELKEMELFRMRFEMLTEIDPDSRYVGNYFSKEYIRKFILKQSDDEIIAMDEQMDNERKDGEYESEDDEVE